MQEKHPNAVDSLGSIAFKAGKGATVTEHSTCSLIYTRTCAVFGHSTSTETPNKFTGTPSQF